MLEAVAPGCHTFVLYSWSTSEAMIMALVQEAQKGIRPSVIGIDHDTDWAPDPWGWADLDDRPVRPSDLMAAAEAERLPTVLVPFVGGRRREVPLLGPATRMVFTGTAAVHVRSHQRRLSDDVFGYRVDSNGAFVHYRAELARRRDRERQLANRYPIIATADLRRFFRSVDLARLDSAALASPTGAPLRRVLVRFRRALGYTLPEGYAAARGLANLALESVDNALNVPFTRWLDDYRLYCSSKDQAESALADLREAAVAAGFELAEEKTAIKRVEQHEPGTDASLGDHSTEVLPPAALLRSLRRCDASPSTLDRRGRFALRMGAETGDAQTISALAKHWGDETPPAWLPRIAWLLSTCESGDSAKLLMTLWSFDDELTEWRRVRLAPALWYQPTAFVASIDLVSTHREFPATRPGIERVIARHRPDDLDRLPPPTRPEEERIRHLAHVEAGKCEPIHSREVAATRSGPPIASFL